MALSWLPHARHGAVVDEVHHGIDRPFRIGAVADDVAETDDPLRSARPRGVEARAERLPVGMDVRKDSKPHAFLPHIIAPVPARVLMDIKHQAACGPQLHGKYIGRNGGIAWPAGEHANAISACAALPGP